jgi:chloramphenicol O-acetyltransferase type B
MISRNKSLLSFVRRSTLEPNSYVSAFTRLDNVCVGALSSIGWFNLIQDTDIGVGCAIGSHCHIGALNHIYELPVQRFSQRSFGIKANRTVIGDDVWIGKGVTISSGSYVATGAVVAAHSFVNKNIEPYEIVGGAPIKTIGYRFDKTTREILLRMKPWQLSDEELISKFSDNFSLESFLSDYNVTNNN